MRKAIVVVALMSCAPAPEVSDPLLDVSRAGDLEECNLSQVGRPCTATRTSVCTRFPGNAWIISSICTRRCYTDEDCADYGNAHCARNAWMCVRDCTTSEASATRRCGTYSACVFLQGRPSCAPYYFSGSPERVIEE